MIASSAFRRVVAGVSRIALAVSVILFFVWIFGVRMPGHNILTAAALNDGEKGLRAELMADVKALAGDIGERNLNRYPKLLAAADFIEASLTRAGLTPRRDSYELRGRTCNNLEVEIRGPRPE